jgi:glycosyltransferase involved in cell wall biosynthesis
MLANTDLRQCNHYRIEQKQQLFERLGREFEVFDSRNQTLEFISALPGASAAIFYRLPAFPGNVRAIEAARAMGVPSFYDIDDLIFDAEHYPEPFETYGDATREFYESLQIGVPLFRAAMALCDHGIASTTALAEHMKAGGAQRQVHVLPNGLDARNDWMLASPPPRVRRDGDIVIFYGSGTKAHNSDFLDLAGPALIQALSRRPNVRVMIAGFLSFDERFEPFRDRITTFEWIPDVQAYWSLLAEADISLAVLAPYATTDAKSEIKWLEAAAMGVPSLVSATHRYREVLEDGVDALVAATPRNGPSSWTG